MGGETEDGRRGDPRFRAQALQHAGAQFGVPQLFVRQAQDRALNVERSVDLTHLQPEIGEH